MLFLVLLFAWRRKDCRKIKPQFWKKGRTMVRLVGAAALQSQTTSGIWLSILSTTFEERPWSTGVCQIGTYTMECPWKWPHMSYSCWNSGCCEEKRWERQKIWVRSSDSLLRWEGIRLILYDAREGSPKASRSGVSSV